RGIYAGYIHTDGTFVPPTDEKQGAAPAGPPARKEPGPEVLDRLKERVDREVDGLLRSGRPLNQMQAHLLARAYAVNWTPAYRSPRTVDQVRRSMDALSAAWRQDPK